MNSGYVYFVACKDPEHRISNPYLKIGQTVDLTARLGGLQTSSPVDLHFVAYMKAQDRFVLEKYFHQIFNKDRVRGEWFKFTESMVRLIRTYPLEYDGLDELFVFPVWSNKELSLMKEIEQLKHVIRSKDETIRSLGSPIRKEYSNLQTKTVSNEQTFVPHRS